MYYLSSQNIWGLFLVFLAFDVRRFCVIIRFFHHRHNYGQ